MKQYAYFPGCSAESTGLSFTKSTDFVTKRIGFKMTEIPDWNCCGTSAAKLTNHELGQALSARNLAIAEQMEGSPDVVAPCAGCYQALRNAQRFVSASDANRERIEELIDMPYEGKSQVVSLLEAFSDPEVTDAVKEATLKPLRGLKVACYYGCTIVRPKDEDSFDVPQAVIRAFKNNEIPEQPKKAGLSAHELFDRLDDLYEDLDDNAIAPGELYHELKELFEANPQVGFVRELKGLQIDNFGDWMVLVIVCHYLINKDDDRIMFRQLEDVFRHKSDFNEAKTALKEGNHYLMET